MCRLLNTILKSYRSNRFALGNSMELFLMPNVVLPSIKTDFGVFVLAAYILSYGLYMFNQ